MNEAPSAPDAAAQRWTCPTCDWLCDDLGVKPNSSATGFSLADGRCAAAAAALERFASPPADAAPLLGGAACTQAEAEMAAVDLLAASRQPLFGGLGTDVAGARSLYRLACGCAAICDPAGGDALMQGVRAQQDRGGFTTTLAEVRNRADVIVCIGTLRPAALDDFLFRCGVGNELVQRRHVVLLGASRNDARVDGAPAFEALAAQAGITTEVLPLHGDLFATAALLAGLVADRAVRGAPPALAALAARLREARYAVIVGDTTCLPAHGALVIENVSRLVATLNLRTRAGALWVGGGNGAGTVNQVFTWLSGLPLRTRAGPAGLEHEPVLFDTARLLADGAVDSLLWVSTFDADGRPPATTLPLIVLGHPALASAATHPGSVFIPVSTPGIGSAGHLFRSDGGAVLPLRPLHRDRLPTLADVLDRIGARLQSRRAGAVA